MKKKHVFATGFEGFAEPLNDDDAGDFMKCLLIETERSVAISEDAVKTLFNYEIINKRIEALKLPISFTPTAYLAMLCLTGSPGGFVTVLIDALNMFEGECVDVAKLTRLYPYGFYDTESFTKLIDDHLKPHNLKWSEIY